MFGYYIIDSHTQTRVLYNDRNGIKKSYLFTYTAFFELKND